MKINKRRGLRAARQGRNRKAELERNRQFDLLFELAKREMETNNMSYWPPFTPEQLAEFEIEDQADKMIANVPHAYIQRYGYHVSFCVFCQRPRKAHIHYSTKTFNDLIKELTKNFKKESV
jgi:hypothetical protein